MQLFLVAVIASGCTHGEGEMRDVLNSWFAMCFNNFGDVIAEDLVLYYLIAVPIALFSATLILHRKRTRGGLVAATAVLVLLLGLVGIGLGFGLPTWVFMICAPHALSLVLLSLTITLPLSLGLALSIRWVLK